MSPTLVAVLGAVGTFLIGMVVLERGLEGLAGGSLGRVLARSTRSPASGAVTGLLLTTALQSSSATTLATVGLVGAGLLTFAQALGIVLGANIGSTTTGWLVALVGFQLDIGRGAGLLLFGGVALHLFARGALRHVGLAAAGFGLLFLGIDALQAGLAGLDGALTPEHLPRGGLFARLALVGIGCVVTLVTQSSGAGVAAAMAAVAGGALTLDQALALVIGMDVGTTGTAVLGALGGTSAMRRTALAHVLFNVGTAVIALVLLDPYLALLERFAPAAASAPSPFAVVGFQTSFNLVGVALALPLAGPFARLVVRLVPERESRLLRGLEPRLVAQPDVALAAAEAVLRRIARRTLRATLRTLAPAADRVRAPGDLGELAQGVESVVAFLARVPVDGRPAASAAHTSDLVHEADHLGRLLARLGSAPTGIASDTSEPFATHRAAVVAALHHTLRSSDGTRAFDPTHLEAVHADLARLDLELRRSELERAALGATSPEMALDALDRQRWLRRVCLHTARITRYTRPAA